MTYSPGGFAAHRSRHGLNYAPTRAPHNRSRIAITVSFMETIIAALAYRPSSTANQHRNPDVDRLDAMRLYTRIVERRSFTAAAHDMDVPRSTVTKVIRQMETRLN